jgi:predicted oxidoreductase
MKFYQLVNTDLEVSRIGYGCMGIGGSWDRNTLTQEEKLAATRAVMTAHEQGITLFDHADIYAHGKSEVIFSEILQQNSGLRDKIIIQSKCGIRFKDDPVPGNPFRYDFSYGHIISSVEGILNRLKIESLDILLLHRPDALVEPEEVARAFKEVHDSGKVRYFGVSNHTGGQIALLQKFVDQPLMANQVELNLLHYHLIHDEIMSNIGGDSPLAVAGTLDYCRLNDIRVQAWAPVAGGKLIDPPEDAEERIKRTVSVIARFAEEKQTSKEAIALAWLLRHPAGIQPIIGTNNPKRIIASCLADAIDLTRDEWYTLFTTARGNPVP